MNYNVACSPLRRVVTISREVDLACASQLTAIGNELQNELREAECIAFDVTGLKYADATFFRLLLRLQDYANKSHAAIRLVGVKRNLERLLKVTGLSQILVYERTP